MKTGNNGGSLRLSKNKRGDQACRTVKKLSRLSQPMEPLESRQMMSVAALAVPAGISAAAMSPTSVKVSWTDSDTKATGYKLLRSSDGGAYAQITQIASHTTLSYTDTTVASDKTYSYRVQAYSASATSSASATAAVVTPLKAPTGLSANVSGSSIVLKWTDNDTTAGSYEIYRQSDGVHFVAYAGVNGVSANTYTDTAVTDGHAYQYEVQAVKLTNTSAVSAAAKVVTPLNAPSKLSATEQSSSQILLGWTDNDSAATGYIVLRSTNGTQFTTLAAVSGATANSFADKTASPFTTYYYQVEATTSAATSPASASASATTPLATPTWVFPVMIGQNGIQFSWSDTDPAAKGYDVLQAIGSGAFSQIATLAAGKAPTWTDNSFTTNAQYSFELEAVNGSTTSAPSTAFTMTTPLTAPTGVTATATGGTSIQLTWTDVDPHATGYTILRAINGVNNSLQVLTTVTGSTTASYTDNSVVSGHCYSYDVIATAGSNQSGMSNLTSAVTPITAPTALKSTALTGTSVALAWTDQDSSATGYNILRSTDGVNFTKIASVTGATAGSYTDSTVSSAHSYYYQVSATNQWTTSAVSNTLSVTTPLIAPVSLTVLAVGTNINLSWTDKDANATGYNVLRSTDGINFTQLAQLSGGTVHAYADMTTTAGQKYYYQVQAIATGFTSAMSNTVSFTITTPSPSPNQSSVSITTLYGDQLVITSTGTDDNISVSQSGTTLTIVADGQTTTQTVPAAGVFVYTRGGADGINIGSTVTAQTTVETIDTGVDDITSAGTNVTVWDDSGDIFTGTGTVHTISAFAGGVAKTTGASLANPKDAGTTMKVTGSLWGTGPVAGDINQGDVGDCYFMSSLAAFAGEQPAFLEQSAVDMGDGTYVVQFMNGNAPAFIRVSNAVSTWGGGSYVYARPGADGDLWGVILEKAYADFRTGANTYASLNSGWMGDVYAAFGVNSSAFFPSSMSASAFFTMVSNDLANGKEVTLGTSGSPPLLVGDHAYTLISATMVNGVATYVVRNPWGVSGDQMENAQGYATLTFAQLEGNFVDGCEAV